MRITLVCPTVSSNSLVRMCPIAKVLARRHHFEEGNADHASWLEQSSADRSAEALDELRSFRLIR